MIFSLTTFILILVINIAWCSGLFVLTQYEYGEPSKQYDVKQGCYIDVQPIVDKAPLWFIKYYSVKLFGEYWTSPICGCLTCMSSLHSIVYLIAFPISLKMLLLYPIYIICLAGFNNLIYKQVG